MDMDFAQFEAKDTSPFELLVSERDIGKIESKMRGTALNPPR